VKSDLAHRGPLQVASGDKVAVAPIGKVLRFGGAGWAFA
jgi:hypothetical protein